MYRSVSDGSFHEGAGGVIHWTCPLSQEGITPGCGGPDQDQSPCNPDPNTYPECIPGIHPFDFSPYESLIQEGFFYPGCNDGELCDCNGLCKQAPSYTCIEGDDCSDRKVENIIWTSSTLGKCTAHFNCQQTQIVSGRNYASTNWRNEYNDRARCM